MNLFIPLALIAFAAYLVKAHYQRKRIVLLSQHLVPYQIDKLMADITEGYMRALGEIDEARQEQILGLLHGSESKLCDQFKRFADAFNRLDASQTRISRVPLGLPYADQLLPQFTLDFRKLLQVHAQGIENAATNTAQRSPKDRAYVLLAELLLMQHSCHWFCRSLSVASARLVLRHQTRYTDALEAVAPETRRAYMALVQG